MSTLVTLYLQLFAPFALMLTFMHSQKKEDHIHILEG